MNNESLQIAAKSHYPVPPINLDYVKQLTNHLGIAQHLAAPGAHTIHTLDNNARALLALCAHYELTRDEKDLTHINTYLCFIKHCLQSEGYFLNYTDAQGNFTALNNFTNLAEANGRAIWALGYLISLRAILPADLVSSAEATIQPVLTKVHAVHSTRAIAFIIKGLYYYQKVKKSEDASALINVLAEKLAYLYKHESDKGWEWFEKYLAYTNSVLPEALLYAYLATGNTTHREVAKTSFNFLLMQVVTPGGLKLHRENRRSYEDESPHGEQALEAAYLVIALGAFYEVFPSEEYLVKMQRTFNWFLGDNDRNKVLYNETNGACYSARTDHSETSEITACSTLAYLLARLTIEKYVKANAFDSLQNATPGDVNTGERGQKQVA